METRASNPCQMDVQIRQVLRCYPAEALIPSGCFLVGILLLPVQLYVGIGLLIAGVASGVRVIGMWRSLFWEFDLCPGVVLDGEVGLIAVWTDLTTGRDRYDYPAVRVLKTPLHRAVGRVLKRGTRLATVASYTGSPLERRWRNFHPIPLHCGTRDTRAIANARSRIPDEAWEELAYAVRLLPRPFRPGLYLVDDLEDEAEQNLGPRAASWVRPRGPRPPKLTGTEKVRQFVFRTGVVFLLLVALAIGGGLFFAWMQNRPRAVPPVAQPGGPQLPGAHQPPAAGAQVPPPREQPRPRFSPLGRRTARQTPAAEGANSENAAPNAGPDGGGFIASSPRQPGPRGVPPGMTARTSARQPAKTPSRRANRAESPPAMTEKRLARGTTAPQTFGSTSVENRRTAFRPSRDGETEDEKQTTNASASQPRSSWKVGQRVEVLWGSHWFPAEVLQLLPHGRAKIHYVGWDSMWDEVVPASRIRLPQPDKSASSAPR
ncbi:MAG: DUF3239 domain-containing protein [Planctomycetes bacterium]|nr:DUF3239 domain-containing protein [Planctomycetota bacterium]